MKMQERELGPLTVRVVGEPDAKGPVVVLLHGFGAPGTDLVPLAQALSLPDDVRWVFPAAPIEMSSPMFHMESRAWWLIDMIALEAALASGATRDLSMGTPEGLPEARAQLLETLAAIDAELSPTKLVLGGFSQGAMLSLDAALEGATPLAGLALLSGTLLDEARWAAAAPKRAGLPTFISHGRQDPLLPFAASEAVQELLDAAGVPVEHIGFDGGHEIPPKVLMGLRAFLLRTLEL